MAARAKLTDRQKKEIITRYVECQNYSQVAREFDVSEITVRRCVKCSPDMSDKVEHKKEQNTLDMLSFMDSQKGRVQELLGSIVEAMDDPQKLARANVRDLATAYGIIVDKYIQIIPPDNSDALAKLDELIAGINHEAER